MVIRLRLDLTLQLFIYTAQSYHMVSNSVTCHPTQVNTPRLNPVRKGNTQLTYPGGVEG